MKIAVTQDKVEEAQAKYGIKPRVIVTNRKCKICKIKFYYGYAGGMNITDPQVASRDIHPDNNACSGCQFWVEQLMTDQKEDSQHVIINGEHYRRTTKNSGFNFGGQLFDIRYLNDPEVYHVYLAHQGTIPAEFKAAMPDNAEFVK